MCRAKGDRCQDINEVSPERDQARQGLDQAQQDCDRAYAKRRELGLEPTTL